MAKMSTPSCHEKRVQETPGKSREEEETRVARVRRVRGRDTSHEPGENRVVQPIVPREREYYGVIRMDTHRKDGRVARRRTGTRQRIRNHGHEVGPHHDPYDGIAENVHAPPSRLAPVLRTK